MSQPCCGPVFWLYVAVCVCLVMFAGLMSGLTLGLMSLSLVDLEVIAKAGKPEDRKNAMKILPVVKNQHLLLCTLLIGNSLAMEALPIFLNSLVPAWGAILLSVTLILAFGEIIPQSVCSRYGLSVGARTAWIVRVLLLVFFPITYPISKVLDWILGKGHYALLRRAELKTLVDMHGNEAGKGGELTHDETTIITGALDLTQKTAKDAMTPISDTFSLDINAKLDMQTMSLILTKGHSRVPIYSGNPTNIIGLILVKNLITCRPEDEIPVKDVTIRKIPRVYDDLPLYDILNEFQKGHSHMAVVVRCMNAEASTERRKSNSSETRKDHSKRHGRDGSQSALSEHITITVNGSPVNHSITESRSSAPKSILERQGDTRSQSRRSDRGRYDNILDIKAESLPSYRLDEEVVGIITMEDLMEELLQEEILDETDEYVDVHNKIKINMLPPKGSFSPRSLGPQSLSQFLRRSPIASPLSCYHSSSNLRSPDSFHVQPSGSTATISSSLLSAVQSLPDEGEGIKSGSPTSYQVQSKQ
ncbi:DUF21 domain-containing protein At2g14520 isoform X1 [Dendrobium catenatum]|uniref:DUF21 domain-containing protein At2g14520 isoform X1 n=1 Tax=Dendrobium catenatum TaxID=906689 RepID=UPI0009F1F5E5|nr:DUF21 domain-containing protein At2g14520 isoform X1 [Dendrobium catenatum]